MFFTAVLATDGRAPRVTWASGVIVKTAAAGAEPEIYTLTDSRGVEVAFFGFDGNASPAAGQFWKATDVAGNAAYVGHASTASTAISSGYTGDGYIEYAYDPADRRYTYTYSTLDSVVRLTEVKAETKTGGTWASPTGLSTVAEVDYEYYTNETNGDVGDLKLVEKTTPMSDAGVDLTQKKYYRYYEGSYHADTNPGYPHHLKMVVDFEGTRNFDWTGDSTFDEDFLTESDVNLLPYASVVLEYDTSHRVNQATLGSSCGCGGSEGVHIFEYESNGSYTDNSGYDTTWASRTIVQRPDGSFHTQVFDEEGQPLSSIVTDDDPDNTSPAPDAWVTYVVRDSNGLVTDVHTPENVTGYTHSTGAVTTSTTEGLIWTYTRETSGATTGYVLTRKWKEGTADTPNYQDASTYDESASLTLGDSTMFRPYMDTRKEYPTVTTTDTGANTWSYSVTYYSSELAIETITTTQPVVSTLNNGSGTAVTTSRYFNEDGTLAFEKSGTGIITHHGYTNGQEVRLVRDADTTANGMGELFEGITIPTGFSSTGTPLAHNTRTVYDPQGRRSTVTQPDSRIDVWYYTRLADQRMVTNHYPHCTSAPRYYSPVTYTVSNQAGRAESRGTIAFSTGFSTNALSTHIDETDSDPILAVSDGSLTRLSTSVYSEDGSHVEESRTYFDIPASGAGTDEANYDPTLYGYDSSGRQVRVKAPHGTITRTTYDAIGRSSASYVGTNDSSFAGGESSGTDNMVKTTERVYDGGSAGGNGRVTKSTSFPRDSTTDRRDRDVTYDVKGNVLLETMAMAPHAFHKVDNLGRRIATSWHTSTANIVVGTDDPTTETSNRTMLSQTFYDELGRAWKTQRHNIDTADGSDDDSLAETRWWDADGRSIKVEGSSLSKTLYDGLGRATHQFTLASVDDTTYAHADDVSGDIVLEERQTVFEDQSDEVLLSLNISREHDDAGGGQTTGALDSNGDGDRLLVTAANLSGRAQMMGYWYDVLGRTTNSVRWGTYGGSNLDRDGMSVPARSDNDLVTTTTYNTDGSVQKTTDPRGLVTYFEYDDQGRRITEVRNYDAGVNSGNPSGTDDNVTVRYEFVDGLQTKLIADMPSGTNDQETLYIYGTTDGTPALSEISTGHLLRATVYPDSTNTGTDEDDINSDDSDVVSLAYNALGQVIYKKDQAGNEFVTEYDDLGRQEHLRWITPATDFDTAVRRITRTYQTATGNPRLVYQYDNATVGAGNVVDTVCFGYDGWSMLDEYIYDRDSAFNASPVNHYSVAYTNAKATNGRKTLRRSQVTMPSGNVLDYVYESTNSHDDAASRLTQIKDGATVLTEYEYLGMGSVVGTLYDEPDSFSRLHDGAGTYDALDRFNRITTTRWTKDLATDRNFYDCDIAWDRGGNITLVEDNVHTGFDVSYAIDDIDRLTRAEEGTWNSSSITSRTRDQQWTLDHVGNWDRDKLDLDGDGNFTGTDEWDDSRTHNDVNELGARDLDSTPGTTGDNYSLTYDAVGNMTDDGIDYEYVWDGFGRLRKILNTGDQSLIAEYKYNGLGHMVARHEDADDDDDVDGSDPWYYQMFDERWRWIATFRADDSDPKEEFVPHQAGLDGQGGSSYIDLVILRDRDGDNDDWTTAADGTLEERIYYCQNWRADVSAIVENTGEMVEWVKYSAYGVPFGMPRGDTDSDGDADSPDRSNINGAGSYDVRYDVDLDGDIDAADETAATDVALGRGALSGVKSRRSYSGLSQIEADMVLARHRVLASVLGTWLSRDPGGYLDGLSLYEYSKGRPLVLSDPLGLQSFNPYKALEFLQGNGHVSIPLPPRLRIVMRGNPTEEQLSQLRVVASDCCDRNPNWCVSLDVVVVDSSILVDIIIAQIVFNGFFEYGHLKQVLTGSMISDDAGPVAGTDVLVSVTTTKMKVGGTQSAGVGLPPSGSGVPGGQFNPSTDLGFVVLSSGYSGAYPNLLWHELVHTGIGGHSHAGQVGGTPDAPAPSGPPKTGTDKDCEGLRKAADIN